MVDTGVRVPAGLVAYTEATRGRFMPSYVVVFADGGEVGQVVQIADGSADVGNAGRDWMLRPRES